MITGTIADVGRDDQHEAGLMRIRGLAGCIRQPDFTSARCRRVDQFRSDLVPSWRPTAARRSWSQACRSVGSTPSGAVN